MTTLVSAELFRLRTIRSPAAIAAGVLLLVALLAVAAALATGIEGATAPDPTELLSIAGTIAAIAVALFAAGTVGAEFRRGSLALSYLATPRRGRALAAKAMAYALVGAAFGGLATVLAWGIALPFFTADGVPAPAADVARLVAGAAAGGALFAVIGVLLATATGSPTPAVIIVLLWQPVESILGVFGIGEFLPFALLQSILGTGSVATQAVAVAVLAGYLAVFSALVTVGSLKRDVT